MRFLRFLAIYRIYWFNLVLKETGFSSKKGGVPFILTYLEVGNNCTL